jgi:hypothetical protein
VQRKTLKKLGWIDMLAKDMKGMGAWNGTEGSEHAALTGQSLLVSMDS